MAKKKAAAKKLTGKKALSKKSAKKKATTKQGKPKNYGAYIYVPANAAYVKRIPPNGPPFMDAVICANGNLPTCSAAERVILVACKAEKPVGIPSSYAYSYVPPAGATTWAFDPVGGISPNEPAGTQYYFKLAVTIQNMQTTAVRTVTDSQRFTVIYRAQTDCGT